MFTSDMVSPMAQNITGLPCSSYDGNHLDSKQFRNSVLEQHHIKVYDWPTKQALPESLLRLIEQKSSDFEQTREEVRYFHQRYQTASGMSVSDVLLDELLSSRNRTSYLAWTTKPFFDRQALPQRVSGKSTTQYVLPSARAEAVCGFRHTGLSERQFSALPSWMTCSKVNSFEQEQSGQDITWAPFLTFQQASGEQHGEKKSANNLCAINGAWCLRALQMLYGKTQGRDTTLPPKVFSCNVEDESAVINQHWVETDGQYTMSPVCRFEFSNIHQVGLLFAWIEAIEEWALLELLPTVKAALGTLSENPLAPQPSQQQPSPTATVSYPSGMRNLGSLLPSLKIDSTQTTWGSESVYHSARTSLTSARSKWSSVTPAWESSLDTQLARITAPAQTPRHAAPTIYSSQVDATIYQSTFHSNEDRTWDRYFDPVLEEISEHHDELLEAKVVFQAVPASLSQEPSALQCHLDNSQAYSPTVYEDARCFDEPSTFRFRSTSPSCAILPSAPRLIQTPFPTLHLDTAALDSDSDLYSTPTSTFTSPSSIVGIGLGIDFTPPSPITPPAPILPTWPSSKESVTARIDSNSSRLRCAAPPRAW